MPNHNDRVAEINNAMLTEFANKGLEDTYDHRIDFLRGKQAAWREDTSSSPEKTAYLDSIHFEISRLKTMQAWKKPLT